MLLPILYRHSIERFCQNFTKVVIIPSPWFPHDHTHGVPAANFTSSGIYTWPYLKSTSSFTQFMPLMGFKGIDICFQPTEELISTSVPIQAGINMKYMPYSSPAQKAGHGYWSIYRPAIPSFYSLDSLLYIPSSAHSASDSSYITVLPGITVPRCLTDGNPWFSVISAPWYGDAIYYSSKQSHGRPHFSTMGCSVSLGSLQ